MPGHKSLNIVKFVISSLIIVVFSALMLNSDKFYKVQEPVYVDSSFVGMGDDNTSIIDIDQIVVDDYDNERGVLQYIVQPGDSLGKIASIFGTTVSHLKKINNIKDGQPIRPKQKLIITDEEKGFLYTMKEKTNVVVFANKYNLNVKDLMTLNYIQDETEILNEGQEIFINIDLEEAYKKGLKKRPIIKVIPKVTQVAYKPVISKPSSNQNVSNTHNNNVSRDNSFKSTVIRKWVYKKPIKNKFYPGNCTWGAAIITPEIFPYIDEYHQARPFGGNARFWYDNAAKAGFSVGKTPRVGSLIVYDQGWGAGAGHVGKVIAYYPDTGKMIIRDMNWKGKFIFTDRWEKVTNRNIIGYIYMPKTPWKPSS